MSTPFDPYYQWLGIRDPERPPNHYRLLGIDLFESNPDVIQSAADRQMAHLRTFQTGPQGALSQQILNEVSAARVCLMNADAKTEYDERLRLNQVSRQAALAQDSKKKPKSKAVGTSPLSDQLELKPPGRSRRADKSWRSTAIIGGIVMSLVFLVVAYRVVRDLRGGFGSSVAQTPSDAADQRPLPPTATPPWNSQVPPTDSLGSELQAEQDLDAPMTYNPEPPEASTEDSSSAGVAQDPATTQTEDTSQDTPFGSATPDSSAPSSNNSVAESPEDRSPTLGEQANQFSPTIDRPTETPAPQRPSFAPHGPFGHFLVSLSQRDLAAARAALDAIQPTTVPSVSERNYQSAEMLLESARQFWDAVAAAHQSMSVGDTITLGGEDVRVTKHGVTFFDVQNAAGEREVHDVRRETISPETAIALVEHRFASSKPTAWRLIAFFLATDHEGDEQRALRYAELAEQRGAVASFLVQAVRKLSGRPEIEAPASLPGTTPPARSAVELASTASESRIPPKEVRNEASRRVLTPLYREFRDEGLPREAWADELRNRAAAEGLDDAERYVLLAASLQRATAVKDVDAGLLAIHELVERFDMDGQGLRRKMLETVVRRVKGDDRRPFAAFAIRLARESAMTDDYDAAASMMEVANEIGRGVPDDRFRDYLTRVSSQITAMQDAFEQLAPVREQLQRDSSDAASSERLARFRLLGQGDFERGLADSEVFTDPALRELINQELRNPSSPLDQFELGQAWYEFGSSLSGIEQVNAFRRAQDWIEKASPSLSREQISNAQEMLDHIVRVLGRTSDHVDLTAMNPTVVQLRFGQLGRNENPDQNRAAVPLPEIGGTTIERFLWAPAPSRIEYVIPADTSQFSAIAYLDANSQAGVRFVVRADGKVRYASPVINTQGAQVPIRTKIPAGSRLLELIIEPANPSAATPAYWVAPQLGF